MASEPSARLTEEHHAFAKARVDRGPFASVSEVLQHGMDLLQRQLKIEELEQEALREVLARRRCGAFIGPEEMNARLTGPIAGRVACMGFEIEFLVQAERDFEMILDHLIESCLEFGESLAAACGRAESRILDTRARASEIAVAAYRGEDHDDIIPGLRH